MQGADRRAPRHVPGTPAPSLVGNCIRRAGDRGRLSASSAVWQVGLRFPVDDELAVTTPRKGASYVGLFMLSALIPRITVRRARPQGVRSQRWGGVPDCG